MYHIVLAATMFIWSGTLDRLEKRRVKKRMRYFIQQLRQLARAIWYQWIFFGELALP